jgi:hypothetical protein
MLTVGEHPAKTSERRFFAMMAFASLAVVFGGFATSYSQRWRWPKSHAGSHAPWS